MLNWFHCAGCLHRCQTTSVDSAEVLFYVVVSVTRRHTVPEVRCHLRWRKWPQDEGATLGREDVEPAQSEERETVGWVEGADETETERIRVEHDPVTDQRLWDTTEILRYRQRQHGLYCYVLCSVVIRIIGRWSLDRHTGQHIHCQIGSDVLSSVPISVQSVCQSSLSTQHSYASFQHVTVSFKSHLLELIKFLSFLAVPEINSWLSSNDWLFIFQAILV